MATVGLDRVSIPISGGALSLTIPILLAPLVIGASVYLALTGRGTNTVSTSPARSGSWLLFWLFTVLLVGLFSSDSDRSVFRLVQLLAIAWGAWAAISIARRLGVWNSLALGAVSGLVLFVGMDVLEFASFLQFGLNPPLIGGVLDLSVTPYGTQAVRLSGGSVDSNRAAMTVTTYAFLLLGDPVVARNRGPLRDAVILTVSAALVLLTISRSGIVAFLIVMVGVLTRLWKQSSTGQRLLTSFLLAAAGVWVWASGVLDRLGVLDIASSRLDTGEGSATSHLMLIDRGLEQWTSSDLFRIIFGHGYGSSHVYLSDYFVGNEYGNYHSLWITMLVEGGIVAFLLFGVLLVAPLFGPRRWLALGMIWFGIFYQSHTDATFWLQIAILWGLPTASAAVAAAHDADNARLRRPHGTLTSSG